MTDYRGGGSDQARIRRITQQREEEKKKFQDQLSQAKQTSDAPAVRSINEKFAARVTSVEDQLKQETIGLVTLDSFRKKKQDLELEPALPKEEPKLKKRKAAVEKSKLSFDFAEEENFDDEEKDGSEMEPPAAKKIMKDPSVDTSFLPDRERDEREREERLKLKKEWIAEQERIKDQTLSITYSYYDGTGHRRSIKVKKGTTIDQFLGLARKEFKELRGVSTDNLLFIKEDIILPHNYSFYELVETKARGKSGPLFEWDVRDDVRALSDASVETEESHAAKIVERRFYESNKHIFPMNRWESFDPNKHKEGSGAYTIRDTKGKH